MNEDEVMTNPTEPEVVRGRDPRLRGTTLAELAELAEMHEEYEAQQILEAERKRKEIARLEQEALRSLEREEARQMIEPYLITTDSIVPKLTPVIKRYDAIICSEGNISAVVGEAKSKKTFLCTALVGSMLELRRKKLFGIQPNRCRVLWVDTEQSPAHIQKLLFRINLLGELPYDYTDDNIQTLMLREASPADRLALLEYGIKSFSPKLVVVDGMSDLINNPNNLEESESLVSRLLALSSEYNCHIMSVLHANPNSDKARGHLGSTLQRKVETMLYVHKTGEISMVEPQFCRNEPFERFAFKVEEVKNAEMLGDDCIGLGVPVECDPSEITDAVQENDCVRILRDHFGGAATRPLLATKMVDVLGITSGNANVKINRAVGRGILHSNNGLVSVA